MRAAVGRARRAWQLRLTHTDNINETTLELTEILLRGYPLRLQFLSCMRPQGVRFGDAVGPPKHVTQDDIVASNCQPRPRQICRNLGVLQVRDLEICSVWRWGCLG